MAAYWGPPMVKVKVLRPCLLVRRTASRLPITSTSPALINCLAMELNSNVSSMS